MRSGGGNAMRSCSIPATARSCGVGSAAQIPPRQVAAGIGVAQPPAEPPSWVQLLPGSAIDPQPMPPPGVGAMARRKPSSSRTDPTRRNMLRA
jgi:hypothetical protein